MEEYVIEITTETGKLQAGKIIAKNESRALEAFRFCLKSGYEPADVIITLMAHNLHWDSNFSVVNVNNY